MRKKKKIVWTEAEKTLGKFILFCILSASPVEVNAYVYETYDMISSCHVGSTTKSFEDGKNEICFCTEPVEKGPQDNG